MAIAIAVIGSSVLGFQITVTDANEGAKLRIERIDNSGYYDTVAVRGADLISPSGATMVFFDHEAPFNTDLTYRVSSFALSDLVTPINTDDATDLDTTVPHGFVLITQVNDSTQRVSGVISQGGLKDWNYESNILSESHVLGREMPVVISDVMSARTGSWRIWNTLVSPYDFDGSGAKPSNKTYLGKWRSILKSGATLLFRSDAQIWGFDDCYFKVEGWNVERPEVMPGWNAPAYPLLSHSIDFKEVERPLTSIAGLGLTTWGDVYASNADWQEVNDKHADWLSVLTNPTL